MKKIIGLDLETTGLLAPEHRIVEIYAGVWDFDTRRQSGFPCNQRINPGRSIAAEAQRVHGISSAMLVAEPLWEKIAKRVWDSLSEADLIVAHNGDGFDIPFLNQEFKRVGLPEIKTPSFDTMLQGRWATPDGGVPNLGALCFACDVPYDPSKAHAADYDVKVMMECFFRGVKWGFFKPLPELEIKVAA